jgi:hypothetical protein
MLVRFRALQKVTTVMNYDGEETDLLVKILLVWFSEFFQTLLTEKVIIAYIESTLKITGVLDSVHHPEVLILEITMFWN